jgi:hypothetical protein
VEGNRKVKEEFDVGEHREDKKRRHHNQGFMGELHGCGWPAAPVVQHAREKWKRPGSSGVNAMEES